MPRAQNATAECETPSSDASTRSDVRDDLSHARSSRAPGLEKSFAEFLRGFAELLATMQNSVKTNLTKRKDCAKHAVTNTGPMPEKAITNDKRTDR